MGFFRWLFRRKKRENEERTSTTHRRTKQFNRRGARKNRDDSPTLESENHTETVVAPPPLESPTTRSNPVDLDELEEKKDEIIPQFSPNASPAAVFHMPEQKTIVDSEDDSEDDSSDDDDGESSSFNLSTDAEDTEYETMRRRLGVITANKKNTISSNDSIGMMTNETDPSVFPNLKSDDEGNLPSLLVNPATGASLVPDDEVEDEVIVQQQQPKVANKPKPLPPKEFSTTTRKTLEKTFKKPLVLSTKDSPDRVSRRQPKFNTKNAFTDAVYGKQQSQTSSPKFDPFQDFSSFPEFQKPSNTTNDGFADFADFANFPTMDKPKATTTTTKAKDKAKQQQQQQQMQNPDPPQDMPSFRNHQESAHTTRASSSSSVQNETSLSELLKTAKSKSRRSNSGSINSAPAYYRPRRGEASSVSDIISSLEAARPKSRRKVRDPDSEDDQENWLFDEVTGALGPRGIAADLESLSGRSGRSGNSRRSGRSGRSSRRKQHRSGDSVDSRHSRYSHRSYISAMSEQSRSVANDLLRLEMQLAMVGDAPKVPRRTTTRRSRISVTAPPGKLGIILANKADSKGTVVSGVRTSSALADKIAPGDRIVAIDGEDVSLMTVSEITTIMARKSEYDRTLTVLTTPRPTERSYSRP